MRRWLAWAAVVVAVVVGAAAVTGCRMPNDSAGSGGAASRALHAVGNTHELCFSTTVTGRTITEGYDLFNNRGPGPVHIDRVEWRHNQGLKVLGIKIFQRQPGDHFSAFGSWRGYPPAPLMRDGGPTMVAAWNRAVPAQGATLPVSNDGQHFFNVIVSFRGARGSAGPVRLSYTDGNGDKGVMDTLVTVATAPHCP